MIINNKPANAEHLLKNASPNLAVTDYDEAPICKYCGLPQILMFDEMGLPTDNPGEAWRSIVPRFHTCEGGRLAEARAELETQKVRDLQDARQLVISLEVGKLADYRFSTWNSRRNGDNSLHAYNDVRSYVTNVINGRTARWLYLHGAYGLGKTHLAISALRQIAAELLSKPLYVVWPQHCSQVKDSWKLSAGQYGSTGGKLWSQMRSAGILLLDDIDKIDTTSWAIQKLYEVVDYRIIHQRPTIITANHSLSELRQVWEGSQSDHISDVGAAILSRINGELYALVEFAGQDQRVI